MVQAVEQSFARRFPKKRPTGGRPPVSPRVLLALELLKHELGESDEDVCQRLRTDVAVMYARGLRGGPADRSQTPFFLPQTRAHFRRPLGSRLLAGLGARHAGSATGAGA